MSFFTTKLCTSLYIEKMSLISERVFFTVASSLSAVYCTYICKFCSFSQANSSVCSSTNPITFSTLTSKHIDFSKSSAPHANSLRDLELFLVPWWSTRYKWKYINFFLKYTRMKHIWGETMPHWAECKVVALVYRKCSEITRIHPWNPRQPTKNETFFSEKNAENQNW